MTGQLPSPPFRLRPVTSLTEQLVAPAAPGMSRWLPIEIVMRWARHRHCCCCYLADLTATVHATSCTTAHPLGRHMPHATAAASRGRTATAPAQVRSMLLHPVGMAAVA